jgi:hypothetical protein
VAVAAKAAIDFYANNFDIYLVSFSIEIQVCYIIVTTALLNSNVCDRVEFTPRVCLITLDTAILAIRFHYHSLVSFNSVFC